MGFHLSRYSVDSSPICRRKALIDHNKIDLVLDVGGNVGQYVDEIRNDVKYGGLIYSFEPLNAAFEILKNKWNSDRNWRGINIGLGDFDGSTTINVSENLHSSSIMPMLAEHEKIDPHSHYVSTQKINVMQLDSWMEKNDIRSNNILLKIDVQGFEPQVLSGAKKSFSKIRMIQLELSFTQLYAGETTLIPMLLLMEDIGFRLATLDSGFANQNTGEMIQMDGIFLNTGI
jgi:FkbM family methyltransferase